MEFTWQRLRIGERDHDEKAKLLQEQVVSDHDRGAKEARAMKAINSKLLNVDTKLRQRINHRISWSAEKWREGYGRFPEDFEFTTRAVSSSVAKKIVYNWL